MTLKSEFQKLLNQGNKFFIVDLNEKELKTLFETSNSEEIVIFNVRSKADSLRNENCKKNLLHVPPSYSMLSDALTQYLVKKKSTKRFLIIVTEDNDKKYEEALKKSATRP